MLAILREKGIALKDKSQITNYLKKLNDSKYGRTKINLGQFEQLCLD
jgi:hypothetical protein